MRTNYLTFCGVFRNEAPRVRHVLDIVSKLCTELVIVVQESEDATEQICREYTDNVFAHPPQSPEESKDFILEKVQTPWTLWFDADEIPSLELIRYIETFNPKNVEGYDGLAFPRVNYVDGLIVTGGQGKNAPQFRMLRKDVRWKPELQGGRIHIHPLVYHRLDVNKPLYHIRTLEKVKKQTERWNELQPGLAEVCNKYVEEVEKELCQIKN